MRALSLSRLGLQKTSLVDFPGHPASMVFTAGCPLRCPYCHNKSLISPVHPPQFLLRQEVLPELAQRSKLISRVVVSGGEPSMHDDLYELFDELASIGLRVKLDTCGWYPEKLEKLLGHPALDFVAMDIKTDPKHYERVGGKRGVEISPAWPQQAERRILSSMQHIRRWADGDYSRYEFRTVLAPEVADEPALKAIQGLIRDGESWNKNPLRTY